MATIKLQSKEDLEKEFIELTHAVNKMRGWQQIWRQRYGHQAKARMQEWEKRVDQKLRDLGLTEIDEITFEKLNGR